MPPLLVIFCFSAILDFSHFPMTDSVPRASTEVETAVTEDINDLFDLAAPPVEKPVVARLVPHHSSSASASILNLEAINIHTDDTVLVIGRSRELPSPQRIEGVEKISGKHCSLSLDPITLKVFICDTSTNGTFINQQRLTKGEKVELNGGDCITLAKGGSDGGSLNAVEYFFQRVKSVVVTTVADMITSLTCSVCQSLYHRPCSVLPCLHVFCAHCISQWVDGGHDTCVECREQIQSIRPSHKIKSCVEQLMLSNPSTVPQYTEGELKLMEEKDTIPPAGRVLRHRRDDDGSENESSEYDSEMDSDASDTALRRTRHQPLRSAPPPTRCRQCATPSAVDGFQCAPDPAGSSSVSPQHLRCQDCYQYFPDRPACGRPQRCFLCMGVHCNLYYEGDGGCSAVQQNPQAGMKPFESYVLTSMPVSTFGGNKVELVILQNYLSENKISVEEVLKDCLAHFKDGTWKPDVTSISGVVTPTVPVCHSCAERVYAALIFHYRRAIPNDMLPDSVTSRPHCWHGAQCRTQFHKVQHAQNFHHVCYQEKRKE